MNSDSTETSETGTAPVSAELHELRVTLDRSSRAPVLYFLTAAVGWLLVAVVLGFISSMKAHYPGFLDWDCLYFLHYGRVQPAFMNAFIYGWGFQAAVGVMIWIMTRLCRAEMPSSKILLIAGFLWNLGVTLGVFAILWGGSTSVEWLEFPRWVWPLLLIAYLFMTVWVVLLFKARTVESVYISVWYFLGACFWFPWIYGTANLLIHHFAGGATLAAAVDGWYMSTLLLLFFVPVGLGTVYYLLPKILGRPVHSYQMALIGFWMLAGLSGWTGMQKFLGGPIPSWMTAVGSAAAILMLIPVGVVALNHHLTIKGLHNLVGPSPTIRFAVFGAVAYTVMSLVYAAFSLFSVSSIMQFTFAQQGFHMLALYAFFSMCMFSAIYFIMPRVSGCEWPSGRMISIHFWFSTYGLLALVSCLFIAGLSQGTSFQNPENWNANFLSPTVMGASWIKGTSVAWAFLVVSNLVFFLHVILMALRLGRKTSEDQPFSPSAAPTRPSGKADRTLIP